MATLQDQIPRAWYMDNSDADQREPHRLEGYDVDVNVSLNQLAKLGVLYWKIDPLNCNQEDVLERIKSERGYTYTDVITISRDKLSNYEQKIKSFFEEHLHADEEIRFILEGSGYFDVRDQQDKWMRIEVLPGDLIVLPAGIYHRFTLDTKNYIKAMRLFKGDPVWTPINRPADNHAARKSYVNKFAEVA